MFIKSLSLYGGFRLFTMFAGFLQIFFISHKFGTKGYGEISLILAYATYINIFIFQWMSKVTSRYSNDTDKNVSILSLHLILGLILLILILPFSYLHGNIIIISIIAVIESYKEHLLEYFRSTLQVKKYGFFSFLNSLTIVISLILIFNINLTVHNYLCIQYALYTILISFYIIKYKLLGSINGLISKDKIKYFKFGYSISLSNSIAQFAFSGVRIIIGQRFGSEVLGIFCILYDSIQRTIVSYMQILNSTIFPLMRNIWDRKNYKLLNVYLRLNFSLLVYIPFFVIFFVMCFLDFFIKIIKIDDVNLNFNIGLMVILISIGIIFNRIKTFHVDYFFIFMYRTDIILRNTLISMLLLASLIFLLNENYNIIYINICISFIYFISLLLNILFFNKIINKSYKIELLKIYDLLLILYFIIALYLLSLNNIENFVLLKIFLGVTLFFMLVFNIVKNFKNLGKVELT